MSEISFSQYLVEESNLNKCPFLSEWVSSKGKEIANMPRKPSRQGVPKGDKMPPPMVKFAFALYEVLLPGFSMKRFADDIPDASYGTVRHWKKDDAVDEILNEYCQDFKTQYWRRLKTLIDSEEINYAPITRLIEEIVFYKNDVFANGLIVYLFRLINEQRDANPFNAISASESLQVASYEREGDQAEARKAVTRVLAFNAEQYDILFGSLFETIESGDTQHALTQAKAIAQSVKQNLIAERDEYFLQAYDLKWEKKTK